MSEEHAISVVDDDESIRQALEGLLRSAGFRAAAFASAEAFLQAPQRWTTGCLILDLRLPGMGGLELQDRLAAEGPRVPIIVLTAHGDEAARTRALGAGAAAFLRKPVDGEALLSAVEAVLKSR